MLRLSLASFLLMAACAAPSKQVQVAEQQPAPAKSTVSKDAVASTGPQPEGKIVCRMERPIGSNIAERVCRYIEDAEKNRQRTQEIMLQPKVTPNPFN
jgi:hypothetical protein